MLVCYNNLVPQAPRRRKGLDARNVSPHLTSRPISASSVPDTDGVLLGLSISQTAGHGMDSLVGKLPRKGSSLSYNSGSSGVAIPSVEPNALYRQTRPKRARTISKKLADSYDADQSLDLDGNSFEDNDSSSLFYNHLNHTPSGYKQSTQGGATISSSGLLAAKQNPAHLGLTPSLLNMGIDIISRFGSPSTHELGLDMSSTYPDLVGFSPLLSYQSPALQKQSGTTTLHINI